MSRARAAAGALTGVALLLTAACSSSTIGHGSATSSSPMSTATSAPSPSTSSTASTARPTPSSDVSAQAQRAFAAMNEAQRVGQLLMVDCSSTAVSAATTTAISQYHVGSVILDGTSYAGLSATSSVTAQLRQLGPSGVGLLIATDQEGGIVQRLQGPGFTRIVTAVAQGQIPPATLQGYAQGWAEQLRQAGVNVNLAPVLDTVPAGFGSNPPIGDLDREFGHTPPVVSSHGLAVVRGMRAGGVDATVKHFPGLGRVTGNTDTTAGVTDHVTTRNDPYLAPFRAAVNAGVPFVMMSTAYYARIDPSTPAAFSPVIVSGMLRGDLGFRGVVISDDIGVAAQVAQFAVGDRAVRFVAAGGDMALTVDANQAGTMAAALLARAGSDRAFKQKVDAAALRVLQAKAVRGLLG